MTKTTVHTGTLGTSGSTTTSGSATSSISGGSSTCTSTTALLNTYLRQVEELSFVVANGDTSHANGVVVGVAPYRNGKSLQPQEPEIVAPGAGGSTQYDRMLLEMNAEAREALYNLQAANAEEVQALQSSLEKMANEYQDYKLAMDRNEVRANEMDEKRQVDLEVKQERLEITLEQQKQAKKQEMLKAQEHWQERMKLEAALSGLEKEFALASKNWKGTVSREQRARVQDQAAAAKKLQAIQAVESTKDDEKIELQLKYQKELAAKDAIYRNRVDDLQATKVKEIRALEARLDKMANDWQNFKFDTNTQHVTASKSMEKKLQATTNQITALQTALEEQKRVTRQEELKTKEHWESRLETQAELEQLQKDFATAVHDWDTAFEREQDARTKDQAVSVGELEVMQKQVRLTEQDKLQVQQDFQRELAAKDTTYRDTIGNLQAEKAREIQVMQSRLEKTTSELQDVKLTSKRQELAVVQAADKQKDGLTQQVANLQASLAQQKEATKQEGLKAQEFWQTRMSLEGNLSELQKDYVKAVQDWEVACEHEQQARVNDQTTAASQLLAVQEQLEMKDQEKMKLQLDMQRDLATKDKVYGDKISSLQAAKAKEIQSLQTRLEKASNDWQDYKLSSNRQQIAASQTAGEKEGVMQQLIANLRITLEEQKEATKHEGQKAAENWNKRMESEVELSQLQRDYAKAVQKWEDAYELEQKARAKDQVVAASQMYALQAQGKANENEKQGLKEQLQRELAAKDALHRNKIGFIEASKAKEVQDLQSRLEALATDNQEYKLSSHREFVEANKAAEQHTDALSQQIVNLQTTLVKQKDATHEDSQKVQEYLDQRLKLEAQLLQFQRESQETLQTLEYAYAREQKVHADYQAASAQKLNSVDSDGRKKVQEARREGRAISERVRIDLTSRLVLKEKEVLQAKITLSDREDLIAKWSADRVSIRAMMSNSIQLVKMRIGSRVTRFRNRIQQRGNRIQQGAVVSSSRNGQTIVSEWTAARDSVKIMARETGTVLKSGAKAALFLTPVVLGIMCEMASEVSCRTQQRLAAANADY